MVERTTHNRLVIGSIPIAGTKKVACTLIITTNFRCGFKQEAPNTEKWLTAWWI